MTKSRERGHPAGIVFPPPVIRSDSRSVEPGMKPSFLLAGGGLAGILLLGACGGSDRSESGANGAAATITTEAATATRPPATAVTVRQFQFMPQELVVKTGSMVTWTNQDQILHTATSGAMPGTADGAFDGPMDGVGQSFTFTFDQPGTYAYFCNRHTSMTGKVVVQ